MLIKCKANRIDYHVPDTYFECPGETGQVVEVQYASLDYIEDNPSEITKTAYVYLPAGYDEADTETRYSILYLMHGWHMTADHHAAQTIENLAGYIGKSY